jgi:hypothetical protein
VPGGCYSRAYMAACSALLRPQAGANGWVATAIPLSFRAILALIMASPAYDPGATRLRS